MSLRSIRNALPILLQQHFSPSLIQRHVACAIGYGSGVFPQLANPTQTTVDLIMIVKDSKAFHSDMLNAKPNDYAGLSKWLGSGYINLVNKAVFPIHFNHTELNGLKIKYATVQLPVVLRDLKTWNLLTLAGRLHKPVFYNVLAQKEDATLSNAMDTNYRHALNVALLTMIGQIPESGEVPLQQLYSSISRLSYAGDIRHTLAVENKYKVENIVKHNIAEFDQIYLPWIRYLSNQVQNKTFTLTDRSLAVRFAPEVIYKLCLPGNLPLGLHQSLEKFYAHPDTQDKSLGERVLMGGVSEFKREINEWLGKVNRRSSLRMAGSNFLAGSLTGNIRYVLTKMGKRGQK